MFHYGLALSSGLILFYYKGKKVEKKKKRSADWLEGQNITGNSGT